MSVVNNALSPVVDAIQKSREGTLEWSEAINAVGTSLAAMPDPILKAAGIAIQTATQLIKLMDNLIVTEAEKEQERAAKRAKKIAELIKEQANDLEWQTKQRDSYEQIEERINSILELRLELLDEIDKYNKYNIENLEKEKNILEDMINTNIEQLSKLGFDLGLPELTDENFGEWITAYTNAIGDLNNELGGLDLTKLKDYENTIQGSINFLEKYDYVGYVTGILDAIKEGGLKGDDILKAWSERRKLLIAQYQAGVKAGTMDQGTYDQQMKNLAMVELYLSRIATAQNNAFDLQNMIDASDILGDLRDNLDEYSELLNAVITAELAKLDIQKELGIIDGESTEYHEKRLALINSALQAYIDMYDLSIDVNSLDKEKMKALLEETGYNEDIINLLQQKVNLEKEYVSELARELDYLSGINNAEIKSLIAKYTRIKFLEETGALTSEQAAIQKAAVLKQIKALLLSLGYGQDYVDKTVQLISSTIMDAGGGNIGQGGSVQSFHSGGTVPKEDLYLLDKGEVVLTPEQAVIWKKLDPVLQNATSILQPTRQIPQVLTGVSNITNSSSSSKTTNYNIDKINVSTNSFQKFIDDFEKAANRQKRLSNTINKHSR
jgi:hypothetical protein